MQPNFSKYTDGLVPVIIQDATSMQVLMLGFMNDEAYKKTQEDNRVTFYSRSKQRLWTKGESSRNFLDVVSIHIDCDDDTILIKATAHGPTCHTGANSCFDNVPVSTENVTEQSSFSKSKTNTNNHFTINDLEKTIQQRIDDKVEGSYTYSLVQKGMNKVAQKVGEEAVETVIEALGANDGLFLYEAADLMYHYIVLLKAKGFALKDIEAELSKRH
jgi:phosphoribosyl-ATP pyrophosphohydrolase/phosphoribosyl-AMP cyclohydrolase